MASSILQLPRSGAELLAVSGVGSLLVCALLLVEWRGTAFAVHGKLEACEA